jgi:hypothetical protein
LCQDRGQLRRDIDSLADFRHGSPGFVQRSKATGAPIVLPINGKAALVVQDAVPY